MELRACGDDVLWVLLMVSDGCWMSIFVVFMLVREYYNPILMDFRSFLDDGKERYAYSKNIAAVEW